jgi:hypothetical protein
VGTPTYELGDREVLSDVYVGVLSSAVREGIGPPLHKSHEPFVATENLTGRYGGPLHIFVDHLPEDSVELAVGP